MKKEILDICKQNIKNSFTEDGQKAADAIVSALDALAADEEKEFTAEDAAAAAQKAVDDLFKDEENTPEVVTEMVKKIVANAIEARVKAAGITLNGVTKELPQAVRNEVAAAIMGCEKKEQIQNAVMAVMTKNGISGLEFARVIDYTLVENFGDDDELYNALNFTPVDEWFVSEQDLTDADITAKSWNDEVEGEKKIQEIVATPVKIDPDYVYKRQKFANKFLAKLRKAGKETEFINWITNELRRINHATQVQAILVGDLSNSGADKLAMFETIKRAETDHLVYVTTAAGEYATIEEARSARDEVKDNGQEIWAVMSQKQLTALAAFQYADGGTTHYRSKEEVAGQLGVSKVYVNDQVKAANGVAIIFITPKEYWVNKDDTIEVAYPNHETNAQNYQYEELVGGAIHGLKSCAVVLTPASPSTSKSGSHSKSGSASV